MQHNDKKIKYISKKMSYALRHNPDKYGIKLDEYGYTDLDHFIKIEKQTLKLLILFVL